MSEVPSRALRFSVSKHNFYIFYFLLASTLQARIFQILPCLSCLLTFSRVVLSAWNDVLCLNNSNPFSKSPLKGHSSDRFTLIGVILLHATTAALTTTAFSNTIVLHSSMRTFV